MIITLSSQNKIMSQVSSYIASFIWVILFNLGFGLV